jgi:hypothetical protein
MTELEPSPPAPTTARCPTCGGALARLEPGQCAALVGGGRRCRRPLRTDPSYYELFPECQELRLYCSYHGNAMVRDANWARIKAQEAAMTEPSADARQFTTEEARWLVKGVVMGAANWGVAVPDADVWAVLETARETGGLVEQIQALVLRCARQQGVTPPQAHATGPAHEGGSTSPSS